MKHIEKDISGMTWTGEIAIFKIQHATWGTPRQGPLPLRVTVNVDIFAQFIFSHISHRELDTLKYDVSE